MSAGALDGLMVVDLSRVLAGPYSTMLLADLGAQVVKIERRDGGDETRSWRPPAAPDGTSTYFASVNRNKTSVSADFRDPRDVEDVVALIDEADIVVENSRPGTMDALGLGYARLSERDPRLIYCSITGFGAAGGASLPGFDLLVQATGGLMSITGAENGGPMKAGVALIDIVTGLHASTGILAALHARDRTGRGQLVEVNLLSSALSALANQASAHLLAGATPTRLGNAHPSIAPYEVFEAADRPLVLAVGTDRQFAALAEVIGAPTLASDDRFATNTARVAHRTALLDVIEARMRTRSAASWVEAMMARGIPAGLINDIPEAFEFASSLGLDPVAEVDGYRTVANPIRLSETPVQYRSGPPALGPTITEFRHGDSHDVQNERKAT